MPIDVPIAMSVAILIAMPIATANVVEIPLVQNIITRLLGRLRP